MTAAFTIQRVTRFAANEIGTDRWAVSHAGRDGSQTALLDTRSPSLVSKQFLTQVLGYHVRKPWPPDEQTEQGWKIYDIVHMRTGSYVPKR